MVFHIYNAYLNSFNISSLFSGGIIIISSTFLKFLSETDCGFTIFYMIFFPINSPVASAALLTTFLEAVFRESSPVLAAISNYCFLHLLRIANDKNPYP